jgi:Glycogen recognition site of AMP-activated protein kinase
MEIRKTISLFKQMRKHLLPLLLVWICTNATAQPPLDAFKSFVVKNGNIYITLSKGLPEKSLDSFIVQYDLHELDLKTFFRTNRPDSLNKLGWRVELNNGEMVVFTKSMQGIDHNMNPADLILFVESLFNNGTGFANKEPMYGYNRFSKKSPFAVKDSLVTFFLRNNKKAKKVRLAGTFNNWNPEALAMQAVDSGWTAVVKLGAGKHYYKFIVDDKWTVDKDNQLVENDGEGNDNSVYYKTNYVFTLAGNSNAKRVIVSGSFNNWSHNEIAMERWGQGWLKHVYLAEGTHTYRFVADGNWFADPANPDQYPNEFGETNSVVCVGKAHLFFVKGHLDAKKVMLMGSFNQWKNYELAMTKTDSGWVFPYVLGHGNYEYNYEVDEKKVIDRATGKEMANQTLIIAPNQTFRLKGFADAKKVCLAGTFNNWSPGGFAMRREGEDWVILQHVAPGKHQYKFVVDGKWIVDPANKLREPNEFGEENSVIWVMNDE